MEEYATNRLISPGGSEPIKLSSKPNNNKITADYFPSPAKNATKSLISRLDNTSPIGGILDGRFSLLAILATGMISGSASEVVRVRASSVSLLSTPYTCCPSFSVSATLP